MKRESLFRIKVVEFLHTLRKTHPFSVQQLSIQGTPDLLVCINGCFVAIELKAVGGKVSKLQEYHLRKIMEAGGISLVASPLNWEDTKATLQNLATFGGLNDQDDL